MHVMRVITCSLCLVLALCSGCATAINHLGHENVVGLYNGTRADILTMAGKRTWDSSSPPHDNERARWAAIAAADLPFSLAFDTVLLPVDLFYSLHE